MAKRTFLWCDHCRRSFDFPDAPEGACPICSRPMRELGWVSAFMRGIMAQELTPSILPSRHRSMIRMIWTANGMGERYYKALAPSVPYNKFEAQVTELLCRGANDGWVRFIFPPSPVGAADDAYRMELDDEERFITEMAALFEPPEASR